MGRWYWLILLYLLRVYFLMFLSFYETNKPNTHMHTHTNTDTHTHTQTHTQTNAGFLNLFTSNCYNIKCLRSLIYKSNESAVGTKWSPNNKTWNQKGMNRYNLSKSKLNYCNINAWWKLLEKYLMPMVKFISSKNKGEPLFLPQIHSPSQTTPVKAQRISLLMKLYAINIQLYQKWTPPWSPK